MSSYAKVLNGVVVQVIRAELDFFDSFVDTSAGQWIQTSYNTYGGSHPDGKPIRMNYAGIGFHYDAEKDAFIPPKPFDSWILNENTCLWEAPIPIPKDGNLYKWNEQQLKWIAL